MRRRAAVVAPMLARPRPVTESFFTDPVLAFFLLQNAMPKRRSRLMPSKPYSPRPSPPITKGFIATARVATFAALALAAGLASTAAGCSSSAGALGAECLRNDDCNVGQCSSLRCRLPPKDVRAQSSGGVSALPAPPVDAGPEAGNDAASDAEMPANPPSPVDAAPPEQG